MEPQRSKIEASSEERALDFTDIIPVKVAGDNSAWLSVMWIDLLNLHRTPLGWVLLFSLFCREGNRHQRVRLLAKVHSCK